MHTNIIVSINFESMLVDIRTDSFTYWIELSTWTFDKTDFHSSDRNAQKNEINYDSIKDPDTDVQIRNDSNMSQNPFHDFGLTFDGVDVFTDLMSVVDEHTIQHDWNLFGRELQATI